MNPVRKFTDNIYSVTNSLKIIFTSDDYNKDKFSNGMRKFLGTVIFCSSFFFAVVVFAAAGDVPALLDAKVVSSCQVNLTWDAVPDIDSYVLYYSNIPAGNPNLSKAVVLGEVDKTKTSFYHTQIDPGIKVIYGIRTKTSGVVSVGRTVSATVTTNTFTNPDVPSSITGNGRDNGKGAEIVWSPVTFGVNGTDIGYEVEKKTYPSGGWTPVPGSPLPFALTSYDDGVPQLDPTSAYQYRVRSFQNDLGCLPKEMASSSWIEALVPTQPQNFFTSYVFDGATPPIDVKWSASLGATSYKVSGTSTVNSTQISLSIPDQPGTTYVQNNPTNGATYEYSVRGCADASCSAPTATSSVQVARSPLEFIVRLIYADDTEAKINLSFLDNLNFLGSNPSYNFKINENNFSPGVSVPTDGRGPEKTLEVKEDAQALNSSFTYAVRADYGGPTSDWSEATVKTDIKYRLRGAAWSGYGDPNNLAGLGWLVMNSDGVAGLEPTKKWSVNIHQDGFMSGVAWAEAKDQSGYGWLSFNKGDLTGCPDDNQAVNCAAFFNKTNREIRGWARFIGLKGTDYEWVSLSNKKIDGGTRVAALPDRDFALNRLWGLVKSPEGNTFLEKLASSAGALFRIAFAATEVPYDLKLNVNNNIEGVAWNPKLGWIAFTKDECGSDGLNNKCLVTVTTSNTPPTVVEVLIEEPTLGELRELNREGDFWCAEIPTYKVSWKYSDADNDAQGPTEIIIKKPDGTVVETINRTAGEVVLREDGRHQIITTELGNPLLHPKLGLSASLQATVQATDARGLASEVSAPSPIVTTANSEYPLLGVDQDPVLAQINIPVKYTANVLRINGSPNSYAWEFQGGTPAISDQKKQTVLFTSPVTNGKAYHLTVVKDGKQCGLWGGNVTDGTGRPPRSFEEN